VLQKVLELLVILKEWLENQLDTDRIRNLC